MKAEDVKKAFERSRLIGLAEREGLATAPGRIQCPKRCSEEKRACSVTDTSNGAMWHCKRCDDGGSAIDLVMATRNLDEKEAIEFLSGQIGFLPAPAPEKPKVDVKEVWRLLASTDDAGMAYLRSRSLDGAVAAGHVRFNVGGLHASRCAGWCIQCWLDEKANQGLRVAVPLFGVNGGLASFQLRSIAPGVESKMAKMSLAGVSYPPGGAAFGEVGKARDRDHRIFLAEGMADTLALLVGGVRVIGAPGTDSITKLLGFLGDLAGRTIVLCPQNDAARIAAGKKVTKPSEEEFRKAGELASSGGACVLTLETPPPHKDPADWLKYVGKDQFRQALDAVQPPPEYDVDAAPVGGSGSNVVAMVRKEADPRPVILIKPDEHTNTVEAIKSLRANAHVYQKDFELVHVVRDLSDDESDGVLRAPNSPVIVAMREGPLRERMSESAKWMKTKKSRGNQPDREFIPGNIVRMVRERGSYPGIRWLEGITECPVLRPDGSVLDTPGYDRETRLIFEPSAEFLPVPPNPTREDVARAVVFLTDEAVGDFPFKSDAHRSAWVAGLLSPIAQPAVGGPIPMFLVDSNTRGSGKSKACDLISIVVTGREMPRQPMPGVEEEWRKRITTIGVSGDPVVMIDNIIYPLGSPSLDAALTGRNWDDRILGSNKMARVKLRLVWYATGNNVQFMRKGDLSRRVLHIRLESPLSNPENRSDFKHRNLLAWARRERPRLLRSALTILRGYVAAHRPDQGLPTFGSFEGWSDLVRGAVVWAGLDDPYKTVAPLREAADTQSQLLERLIAAWEDLFGSEPRTLPSVIKDFDDEERLASMKRDVPKHPALFDVFAEIAPVKNGRLDSVAIGIAFRGFRDRVINGKRLESCGKDRTNLALWRVIGNA